MSTALVERAPAPAPVQATRLVVEVAALTHRGARRSRNEDTIAVGGALVRGPFPPMHRERFALDHRRVVVIADGMGGHPGGDVASCYAAAHLAELLDRKRASESMVERAVKDVNRELFEAMASCPTHAGMGTTVAGLHFGRDAVIAFNAGDSRIYRLNGGRLARVSVDDREAGTGAITRCLGGAWSFVDVDPHVLRAPADTGDVWLLCTDGLSDLVPEHAIAAALADDPASAAEKLVDLAMDAGGDDNISMVIASLAGVRPRSRR
jgi:serine/threonine protein phosphatase PrpC